MSKSCTACGNIIQNVEYMDCTKCKKPYDIICLNIKKEEWKKLTLNIKEKWLCPSCSSCRPKKDNSSTPARPTISCLDVDVSGKDNVNTTRGSNPKQPRLLNNSDVNLSDILLEIGKLREEVSEIKVLRTEFSNLRTQFESISTTLNETIFNYKKRLDSAEKEIMHLKGAAHQSQKDLEKQEQYAISDEIEVVGIPETTNEDLLKTIITTSTRLGVDLKESDVSNVYRIGPKRTQQSKAADQEIRPRPILVKLVRRLKRDDIIKASKSQKKFTTEGITAGPHRPVYINERLTQNNRLLFRNTRLRSKKHNFRFCWIRNGNIFIREGENKPALRIQCTEDLDRYIGPADNEYNAS